MDGYWQVVAEQGPRAQSVSRGLPAARGGRRDGRAGGGEVRAARRVLLSQVPARAGAVVLAARQPGLPQPAGHRPQSGAARRRIPRSCATATSWTRATSSRAARPPCATGSKEEVIKGLRVGNLMVLLQIGSMPHELTLKNIDLFAREVLPAAARHRGTTRAGTNHWWPERLRGSAPARAARRAGAMSGAHDGAEAAARSPVWQNQVRMRVHVEGQRAGRSCSSTARGASTWDPFLDALAEQLHGLRARSIRARRRASRTPSTTSTTCGTWSSATTSCCEHAGARRRRRSSAIPSAAMVACEVAAALSGAASAAWRCIDPHRPLARRRARHQLDAADLRQDAAAHVFHDPEGAGGEGAVRACPTIPRTARAAPSVGSRGRMGSTGKFIWPIPDKGLKKRIHRVTAPHAADLGRGRSPGAARLRGGVRAPPRRRAGAHGRAAPATRPISSSRRRVARVVREFLTG